MQPLSLIALALGALIVITSWVQTNGKPIDTNLVRQSRQFLSTGSSDISDVIGTPFITQSIAKQPIYTGLSDATKTAPKGGSSGSQLGSAASGKGPTKTGGGSTDTKKGSGGNSGGNKKNGSSNNKNSGGNKDKNSSEEEGSSGSSESQESAEPGYGYDTSESREEYDD